MFAFIDEVSMEKYLGVDIERLPDNSGFSMTRPYLIECILDATNIDLITRNSRPTTAVGRYSQDMKMDLSASTTGNIEHLPELLATFRSIQGQKYTCQLINAPGSIQTQNCFTKEL